jgi:chromate reductase
MIIMGQPELYLHWKEGMIDSDAQVVDEAVKKRVEAFLERYALWVERVGVKSA